MKIAIVEDNQVDSDHLQDLISQFSKAKNVEINTFVFNSGLNFLYEKVHEYDAIFLDIDMPGINGLSVAKELRDNNFSAPIVFVTNFENYAIEGYNVSAIDFALKPLNYSKFETIMLKINDNLERSSKYVFIKTNSSVQRINLDAIYYIESYGHLLYIITDQVKLEAWMSLKDIYKKLDSPSFVYANKSTIVNLRHVAGYKNGTISIGNHNVELTKTKKDAFLEALYSYINK